MNHLSSLIVVDWVAITIEWIIFIWAHLVQSLLLRVNWSTSLDSLRLLIFDPILITLAITSRIRIHLGNSSECTDFHSYSCYYGSDYSRMLTAKCRILCDIHHLCYSFIVIVDSGHLRTSTASTRIMLDFIEQRRRTAIIMKKCEIDRVALQERNSENGKTKTSIEVIVLWMSDCSTATAMMTIIVVAVHAAAALIIGHLTIALRGCLWGLIESKQ